MKTILSVRNLSKRFEMHTVGGTRVVGLDDVSFDVREGEFLAVVGESGSGKSSLLKCLYRTYDPSAGSVRYESADRVVELDDARVRRVLPADEYREEVIA
ncbi:ATP-binding cassette domain-containing protein [Halegenticoccus soli]|uniref:ATP-binding cassette domain-containing protein n=1 Tax=Halegenticoccus soli TaxID=1985678 RepID=UPI0018EA582C|nr:ATP-binding cassette domain-containing protein [Halegenticoccus soli]